MSDIDVIEMEYNEIINSREIKEDIFTPSKINTSSLKKLVRLLILHVWDMYSNKDKVLINIH